MEILEGRLLSKQLLERYSKNPRGWNFTISPAVKDGFYDALVSSPDESWQLKLDSIFKPAPVMLGAKVEIDYSKIKQIAPVSYGYRRLDNEALMKILSSLAGDDESRQSSPQLDSVLANIDPVVPRHSGSYAQGPFVFTNEGISNLSPGQHLLEDKLSSEMRKLMRSRFSGYG